MSTAGEVKFGPAGWSYQDWKAPVFGDVVGGELELISEIFETVEINTTFYRLPTAAQCASWTRKVAQNPAFQFTVKLWHGFTHELAFRSEDVARFRGLLSPLVEADKLGAVLIQFPWRFQFDDRTNGHVARLLDGLDGLPCALEVRHRSWDRADMMAMLAARNVAFCNIDQPLHRNSLPPTARVTADLGYVRLHGRNLSDWFRADANRDQRYHYRYRRDELDSWAQRLHRIAARARKVFVVTNNHFSGNAVWNALELRHLYDGKNRTVPSRWLASHPPLSLFCSRRAEAQGELFAPISSGD